MLQYKDHYGPVLFIIIKYNFSFTSKIGKHVYWYKFRAKYVNTGIYFQENFEHCQKVKSVKKSGRLGSSLHACMYSRSQIKVPVYRLS